MLNNDNYQIPIKQNVKHFTFVSLKKRKRKRKFFVPLTVSPTVKHSKTKQSHTSSSSDGINGKKQDDSRRSSSSIKSSSRSKSTLDSTANPSSSTRTSTNNNPTMLDPLTFAAAAAAGGGLTFPCFYPSLLSQTPSTATTSNSSTYPFSTLSSSLTNPTAGLYPFLSPDWFTSSSSLSIGNVTPGIFKCILFVALLNIRRDLLEDSKQAKKRSKSIRTLTEEQEKNSSSLLHLALVRSIAVCRVRFSVDKFGSRSIQQIQMICVQVVEVAPMKHLLMMQNRMMMVYE